MTLELVDGAPHGLAAWSASRDGELQTAELICIHSRPSNWGQRLWRRTDAPCAHRDGEGRLFIRFTLGLCGESSGAPLL